jgi:hypothetical protein
MCQGALNGHLKPGLCTEGKMKARCNWFRFMLDRRNWPLPAFDSGAEDEHVLDPHILDFAVQSLTVSLVSTNISQVPLFWFFVVTWFASIFIPFLCGFLQTTLWTEFRASDPKRGMMHCLRVHVCVRSATETWNMTSKQRLLSLFKVGKPLQHCGSTTVGCTVRAFFFFFRIAGDLS